MPVRRVFDYFGSKEPCASAQGIEEEKELFYPRAPARGIKRIVIK